MYYVYILWSSKSKIFYTGSTKNLVKRLDEHKKGLAIYTKPHRPWKLVFYSAFDSNKRAIDFEKYLKTGSGKSLMYRRLVDVALKKDDKVISGIPKL